MAIIVTCVDVDFTRSIMRDGCTIPGGSDERYTLSFAGTSGGEAVVPTLPVAGIERGEKIPVMAEVVKTRPTG